MGFSLGLGLLNRWDVGGGGGGFLGLFHVENAMLQFGRDIIGVCVGGDIDFLLESKPLAVGELPVAGDSLWMCSVAGNFFIRYLYIYSKRDFDVFNLDIDSKSGLQTAAF